MRLLQNYSQLDILSPHSPFRFSRTALALILATIFLAVILASSFMQHINRSQKLMQRFLQEKGETVITAIEAGMRTSMMHFIGSGDPLQTLITESSRENDIIFIRIQDGRGTVWGQTGDAPPLSATEADRLMRSDASSVSRVDGDKGIFMIAQRFHLRDTMGAMPMMMGRGRGMADGDGRILTDGIISVGLSTKEFDLARKQDIQHALFMGAILFLVGSAGLYFLFLYQGMRVAETTLANMELYTGNVVESIPAGLITLDSEERILAYNRRLEEIIGQPLAAYKGRKIAEAFPGWQVNCADIRSADLERSMNVSGEGGKEIPVTIGGSAIVSNEGKDIGTVLIIRDMTVMKEMEQQLERSRRMAALGKMAAGIAHEIRNPLGTLRGFAHYFGNQPGASAATKGYADLMVGEVDRLNRNISELLQFARPRDPLFAPVDLAGLMTKTVALLERDFAEHQLRFRWQCNQGITFEADQDMFLQVLMNLLKNSMHATPAGGEIVFTGAEDQRFVRITVADTGCGMTEQEKEKMFDPFFTTRKTGTGLGLAISHQIVEQHRGAFDVATTPGKGTTVTVILPKTQETAS